MWNMQALMMALAQYSPYLQQQKKPILKAKYDLRKYKVYIPANSYCSFPGRC